MKCQFFLLIILLIFITCKNENSYSKEGSEEFYKEKIQKEIGGQLEYIVKNGRIDLLTDEVAYEITWASDWKASIGKSLWYGMQTHRSAGIILIIEKKTDLKYKKQLETTIEYMNGNKEIVVKMFPDDFE